MSLTKEIQKAIGARQVMAGQNPVCENVSFLLCNWEADVMSLSPSGYLCEFEVKISRSDFQNEKKSASKQLKHTYYATPIEKFTPNYLVYVCPWGLIQADEIPIYAGLIYYAPDGDLLEQKRAPLIHRHKHSREKLLEKINRIYAERFFLGGCKLTLRNQKART